MPPKFSYYLLQADEVDTAAGRILTCVNESLAAEPLIQPLVTLAGQDRAALQLALAPAPPVG